MATTINPLAGAENLPAILTKQQAALYVQATPRFLERAIKSGRLKACKLSGKFVRIRLKDLEAFLESARRLETANERRVKSKGRSNACWAAYSLTDSKSERYG